MSVPWTARDPVQYRGPSALVASLARGIYGAFRPIVARFPFPIFLGAVFASIVGVFVVALIFDFVDRALIAAPTNAAGVTTYFGGPLALAEARAGLDQAGVPLAIVISALLWPLQFNIIRDLTVVGGIFGFINVVPAFAIWWERKVAGRIQSRMGPMRVGGWHGWAQSVADGIKLVSKEDLVPDGADGLLFRAAPYLTFVPVALAFVALPFGSYWALRNLDVGLIFVLAMMGVEVVGVIVAGWASNSKWTVYGAMREACQMVSYEIPMGMALLLPVMCVGSISLNEIGDAQAGGWHHWLVFRNPFVFGAGVAYYIASLASCKRAPFDLPESESELVAGFHTEYSGFRWSLFFFAEYAAMFVVSALATILFFGAWNSPLPASWGASLGDGVLGRGMRGVLFSGPLWFVAKSFFLLFVQIWVRWTLPRIRIDQVLYSCVQVMLPVVMVLLLGNTLWEIAAPNAIKTTVNWMIAALGAALTLGMVVIAVYGYTHGRRLVGTLAVEQLPGA